MVSEDIQRRRDEFLGIMHDHGEKTPAQIIESVRETQAELLAIFRSCDDQQASKQPADGEWSMRDLAMHAYFTERLIAKLVHHLARGTTPSAEDFEGAGIGMMPKEDGRSYGEIINAIEQENQTLLDAVGELPDARNIEMKLPHPFFGPLNCLEWAGFQRVHDLDHIQHARKSLAATA
jgi:hypothetical protein